MIRITQATRFMALTATAFALFLPTVRVTSAHGEQLGVAAGVGRWGRTGGPRTGLIQDLAFDLTEPSVVYASTYDSGVLKSVDGGLTWAAAHRGLMDANVKSLALDPADHLTLYAGTGSNGVFRSTDGAQSWSRKGNGLPVHAEIHAIAVDPIDHLTVYAGTVEPQSIYKSVDGGDSWILSDNGLPDDRTVRSIALDPADPSIIYVGTERRGFIDGGVYKSTDAGATWIPISSVELSPLYVYDLVIDPGQRQTVYAAGFDEAYDGKGGVFKTTDAGTTWTRVKKGDNVHALAMDPNHPRVLYAGTENGMAKSVDRGSHWRSVSEGITGFPVDAVEVDPTSARGALAGTGTAIFRTVNGGLLWDPVTNILGGSMDALAADPMDGEALYVGTQEDGVLKTTDGGSTWLQANVGLPDLSFLDVQALAVDPTDPQTLYATPVSSGVFKSSDGATTWAPVNQGISHVTLHALSIDPANPQTIYAGGDFSVYKSVDGGTSWVRYSTGLSSSGEIKAVAVDPGNPLTVYAGAYGDFGGVYKSTDGGATWVKSSQGIGQVDDNAVSAIVPDPSAPSTLYAVATCASDEECGDAHVYKSIDGASGWVAVYEYDWADFTSLAMDPTDPATLYAGGDGASLGVVRTTDGGTTWEPINQGLTEGTIFVDALVVSASGVPYAGTWDGVSKFNE
jgi:photosystem II stability/assembly factor-like uncharacterized protein